MIKSKEQLLNELISDEDFLYIIEQAITHLRIDKSDFFHDVRDYDYLSEQDIYDIFYEIKQNIINS